MEMQQQQHLQFEMQQLQQQQIEMQQQQHQQQQQYKQYQQRPWRREQCEDPILATQAAPVSQALAITSMGQPHHNQQPLLDPHGSRLCPNHDQSWLMRSSPSFEQDWQHPMMELQQERWFSECWEPPWFLCHEEHCHGQPTWETSWSGGDDWPTELQAPPPPFVPLPLGLMQETMMGMHAVRE
mmetsp:Transcript_54477/g.138391  ORF Transcript_54477/g.138391 Transcript_54477/m.138391 type:complete len:183 (-) Transcript_54477:190-738(-)